MLRRRDIFLRLFPYTLVCAAAGPALAGPEIGLHGSYLTEDCAGDESCVEEALVVRVAAGERHRFRASASGLRVQMPLGVARTLAGSVPLEPEQTARRRQVYGNGSGRGSGNGSAGGSGGTGGNRSGITTAAIAGTGSTATVSTVEEDSWVTGAGDVYLGLSSRVAGGGSRLFALDLEVDVKAPTASEEKALGTGEWDGRLGVAAERKFWSMTLFGGVGWSRLGDPEWIDFEDSPDGFIGLETEPMGPELRWLAWVEGYGEIVAGAGPDAAVAVGCRSAGPVPWRVTVSTGLTRAAEDLRITMGFSWSAGRPARRTGGPGA